MADGDILSVTILSDGWHADIEIEGLGTGGTYLLDSSNAQLQDRSTAKVVFTVTSEGYNSSGTLGTVSRTVRGTTAQRQEYPNNASNEESVSGSDVIVRVALDAPIYNDDKNGGAGTSGTDPTVTILADFYTQGGTGSNLASGASVTNNSTLDYPLAFGQWDHVDFQRVKDDFRVAAIARHFFGVACVRFDVDGVTSANNENATVSTITSRQRSGTSLYAECHETTIDISGFTQDENMDLRFRVYPVVGDASSVYDTDDYSSLDPITNRTGQVWYCDKDDAVDNEYWCDSVSGDDGTGDGSSGSPYATIQKCLSEGANIVNCEAGTYTLGTPSSAPSDVGYWRVVRPASGEDKTTVLVKCSSDRDLDTPHLKFEDVEFQPNDGSSWIDGENANRWLWFDDCDMDPNSLSPTVGVAYRSRGVWFTDCIGEPWKIDAFSSARLLHSFDGCHLPAKVRNAYRIVACKIDGPTLGTTPMLSIDKISATAGDETSEGCLVENNLFTDITNSSGGRVIEMGVRVANTLGFSVSGNVVELSSGGGAGFFLFADGITVACENALVHHNTVAGQRGNLFYNDTGTSAAGTTHVSFRWNAFSDIATKHDLFGTPSGNRTGRWEFNFGVFSLGNIADDFETANSFDPEYVGVNSDHDEDQTTFFEDDQSEHGSAGGNGDYTPATSSPLRNVVISGEEIFGFDLFGTARPNDGTGSAGAVELVPSASAAFPFNIYYGGIV